MKSFLCKGKKPIVKWGMIPDNVFFEGKVPEGCDLAISPSEGYIIIDVDRHGDKNGFNVLWELSKNIRKELRETLNYDTRNGGKHYWFKYTGNVELSNKASNVGIDLRTHKGYVIWYPENDIRNELNKIKNTSEELNKWLEELFTLKK